MHDKGMKIDENMLLHNVYEKVLSWLIEWMEWDYMEIVLVYRKENKQIKFFENEEI